MTIAIDAMGGDPAPRVNVEGAVAAAVDLGLETLLVGKKNEIEAELKRLDYRGSRVGVVEADEVVRFDEPSITPIRKKRRSSVRVAAECVRDGRASGMFTAGHTGAAMVVAKVIIGVVEGIDRPALATVLPGLAKKRVLLDVGANLSCRPEHYRDFAVMGHFYAQEVLGTARPKIGLMSVGEEEGKGTETTREVFALLKESGLNFVGNVEGRDVYGGDVDVIVTDGFTGNVILKVSEGMAHMVEETLKQEITRSLQASMGFLLSKDAFRAFKKRLDYSEYGGAPPPRVAAGCLIGHGRSNPKAAKKTVRAAHPFAKHRIPAKIRDRARELAAAGPRPD